MDAPGRRDGRELSLARPVQLLQSEHPSLLVTWGLWRPKVILPRAAQSWTEDRAAIVLRHELAHIRRGDWVVQIAGELLRTAYWFNPLVWIACARLRQESEQACDDEVLTSGVDGPDYATHLVELARLLKAESAPRLPAPAIARSSSLERRIRAMLDARLTRTPATRLARFMTAAALLTFTVALAAAQTGPVTFSGSVFDPTGAPVPGATVVLTNTQKPGEVRGHEQRRRPLRVRALAGRHLRAHGDAARLQESRGQRHADRQDREARCDAHPRRAAGDDFCARSPSKASRHKEQSSEATTCLRGSTAVRAFNRLSSLHTSSTGGRVSPPSKIKDVKPIYPSSLGDAQTCGQSADESDDCHRWHRSRRAGRQIGPPGSRQCGDRGRAPVAVRRHAAQLRPGGSDDERLGRFRHSVSRR